MIRPDWKENLRAEFRPVMIPKAVLGAVFMFGFIWGFLAFGEPVVQALWSVMS